MSSSLKQHITYMVKQIIPLGKPRRQSTDGTSHPVSGRHRPEPPEKTPKLPQSCHPKPILPVRNPELGQRESVSNLSKVSNKSSKTELKSCKVVMRNLQAKNGNILSCKDVSPSPMNKKEVQRTSSYEKTRHLSLALSRELNENLRVSGGGLPCISKVKSRRHTLPQSSNSRPISSYVQERPKSSVNTAERILHHPDQRKEKVGNRDHKTFIHSNMSPQKELSTPHRNPSPEGRLSLSAKRKREPSTGSEKDVKRQCIDVRLTPSPSIINSPPKFVRQAFSHPLTDNVITITDNQSFKPLFQTSDTSKPRPSVHRQLFKPETCSKSNADSDKTHSIHVTKLPMNGESKDAMVAHANKNPKSPPSQPHLRKISPKSSTTADSIEDLFKPDLCLPASKTHSKNIHVKRESCAVAISTSMSSHKESVKVRSPPRRADVKTPSFAGQAGSCKMETEERTQLKVEESRSPKANMPVSAASVKAERSSEKKHCTRSKDPSDPDLRDDSDDDLRVRCTINLSTSSSDDEELLPSLKELMDWRECVPVTPERDAFSEPNTPVPKAAPKAVKTKAVNYRNTLEKMLQEKEQYQRSKELERQLLESCQEDLLNLNEDENSETKEVISHEQREFLEKFSVTSCAIRDIHPGEEVFIPAKFGRLFDHQTLDLRKIGVTPQNRSQEMFLQTCIEQVLSLISAGLFTRAYSSCPCQPEVTRWLFQMMSVHPNPITSSMILESLRSIAVSAAQHIVESENQRFKIWVPTVQDIALVFINMGASFISLFPLEALQPTFTEGDLLEGVQPKETSHETLISDQSNVTLPVHNFENVLKYLSLCTALCPKAYTDEELLLLVTVVCRIGLETHFKLVPTGHFSLLLHNLLKNITHWEVQLSKACQTLTDLSEDHHNLRRLVYLLPDSSRGKQFKQHLSVSIISKLLNQTYHTLNRTYKVSDVEFKLSELKPFLPQMRPSSLVKALRSSGSTEDGNVTLDQQAYYLCYSLLTLTNEASNFEFLPSNQRNELRSLSSQLEKHIKCDIRESEKTLYRSKVKDFVARIYTKWQVLLVRTRPQEGKLYDYWKPPPEDEIPNSPQTKTCLKIKNTSGSTGELSIVKSKEDAESKDEDERKAKKHEEPMALGDDESAENHVEEEVENVEAKQQLDYEDEKLEEVTDEMLFDSAEELMKSDEDLMREEEQLLNEDEESHEDRQQREKQLEELVDNREQIKEGIWTGM
ncbi:SMC5-SMC6 complex localization factor protein 2 isoform X2 [Misgurnus anguillicaudatus]|uniref:SMC5-SMC6 complex localization factor protein 2 isoform X2 n=1 Tax=Misgurnus anguillicaudatus TaxID=75329 RepID=UPI003CCF6D2A